jgi:hypothetical protein
MVHWKYNSTYIVCYIIECYVFKLLEKNLSFNINVINNIFLKVIFFYCFVLLTSKYKYYIKP